jgi:hypothetical protein
MASTERLTAVCGRGGGAARSVDGADHDAKVEGADGQNTHVAARSLVTKGPEAMSH